jgi:hypothetical protein
MDNGKSESLWLVVFDKLTVETVAMFVFCEAIGLPFCYSAADLMMHSEYQRGFVGFVVGLPFVALGVSWSWVNSWLRKRFPQFAESVTWVIRDFRGWLLLIFIASVYLWGPHLLRQVRHIPAASRTVSAKDVAKASDNATAFACPPISASAMELNSAKSQIDRLQQQLVQANTQIAELQNQRHPSITPTPIQSTGPISWNDSFAFSQTTDTNGELVLQAIIFEGKNTSSKPIRLINAYIISELTGEKEMLQVGIGIGQFTSIGRNKRNPAGRPSRIIGSVKTGTQRCRFVRTMGKATTSC